jgi:hypothetical protein
MEAISCWNQHFFLDRSVTQPDEMGFSHFLGSLALTNAKNLPAFSILGKFGSCSNGSIYRCNMNQRVSEEATVFALGEADAARAIVE